MHGSHTCCIFASVGGTYQAPRVCKPKPWGRLCGWGCPRCSHCREFWLRCPLDADIPGCARRRASWSERLRCRASKAFWANSGGCMPESTGERSKSVDDETTVASMKGLISVCALEFGMILRHQATGDGRWCKSGKARVVLKPPAPSIC